MGRLSFLAFLRRIGRPAQESAKETGGEAAGEGQERQMRILIISDTHRRNENFLKLIERVRPLDMLIHCGDVEGNEAIFTEKAGCPVEIIAGNNDFFTSLPREREFYIGKYHVWLTHGHNYYVSMGDSVLKEEAVSRGADIVMFGHTHRPMVEVGKKLTALNPGSLSFPRQEGRRPSYILMELDKNGEAHYHLNFL